MIKKMDNHEKGSREEKSKRQRKINTRDEAAIAIRVFNYKYHSLLDYSFFKSPNTVRLTFTQGIPPQSFISVSEEQISAVVLHLRFFLVKNEFSSIHHLPEAYRLIRPPTSVQARFDSAMEALDAWMKEPSKIDKMTNRDLLDVLLYGGLVHRNRPFYYNRYDELMQRPLIQASEYWFFSELIEGLFVRLAPIAVTNKDILDSY